LLTSKIGAAYLRRLGIADEICSALWYAFRGKRAKPARSGQVQDHRLDRFFFDLHGNRVPSKRSSGIGRLAIMALPWSSAMVWLSHCRFQ
jgi:hypothetical protein